MQYYNWQRSGLTPGAPYNKTSPNIAQLRAYLLANYGGMNLGTYGVRPVTGGTQWSTHAFGGALDWGYHVDGRTDYKSALEAIDFMIEHHEVLGVQMIVDEGHNRTWKCYRPELGGPGWKSSVIKGGSWLHIETTRDMWPLATPIASRLPVVKPDPPEVTTPTPEAPTVGKRFKADDGDVAEFCVVGGIAKWIKDPAHRNFLRFAGQLDNEPANLIARADLKKFSLVGPQPVYPAGYTGPVTSASSFA